MSTELLAHVTRVRPLMYTTLVIRCGGLYERYYPTFDHPDYTLLRDNLSIDEVALLESVGISNHDK